MDTAGEYGVYGLYSDAVIGGVEGAQGNRPYPGGGSSTSAGGSIGGGVRVGRGVAGVDGSGVYHKRGSVGKKKTSKKSI